MAGSAVLCRKKKQAMMKQLLLKSPLTTNLSALDPHLMSDVAKHEVNKTLFCVSLPNLLRVTDSWKVMQTKPKNSTLVL